MTTGTAELLQRWEEVAGSSAAARAAGEELLRRWSEPQRHYHTVEHLSAVLQHVDVLLPSEPHADRRVLVLAGWFHDAVYDPRRSDNEELSAQLAKAVLGQLGLGDDAAGSVAELVRMTATHTPSDAAGRVLADADLAVLARPQADYDDYAAAVRREYSFVPDEAWQRGRAAVLETLLAADPLYSTALMAPLEARAKANLQRELTALRAG